MVRTSPLKSLYQLTFSAVNQISRSFCRDDRAVSRPKKTDERVPIRDVPATATRNLDVAVAQHGLTVQIATDRYTPTLLSTREALAGLMAWRKSLRRDASVARQDPDRHAFRRWHKIAFSVMPDWNERIALPEVVAKAAFGNVVGAHDAGIDLPMHAIVGIGTGLIISASARPSRSMSLQQRRGDED